MVVAVVVDVRLRHVERDVAVTVKHIQYIVHITFQIEYSM